MYQYCLVSFYWDGTVWNITDNKRLLNNSCIIIHFHFLMPAVHHNTFVKLNLKICSKQIKYNQECFFLTCFRSPSPDTNFLSQSLHSTLSVRWMRMCWNMSYFRLNPLLHTGQENGRSSECRTRWRFRFCTVLNPLWHSQQMWGWVAACSGRCFSSCSAEPNPARHSSHLYGAFAGCIFSTCLSKSCLR